MFTSSNMQNSFQGLALLFNLIVRPKAYFQGELNRILDEQYDLALRYWPEDVRFAKDAKDPYTTEYVKDFPEKPTSYPENLKGMTINSTSSFSFTPVKKKWLTQEFLAAVDKKVENLVRATNFPECTLRLNGFDRLREIAADDTLKPNERMSVDMYVNISINGNKKAPAPQQ